MRTERTTSAELKSAEKTFNPYKVYRGIFIPEGVLQSSQLSPSAKLVFGHLLRRAGKRGYCWPSVEEIGEAVGLKESRTKECIDELAKAGLISRHRRYENGVRASNTYKFLRHEMLFGPDLEEASKPPSLEPESRLQPTAGKPALTYSRNPGSHYSRNPGCINEKGLRAAKAAAAEPDENAAAAAIVAAVERICSQPCNERLAAEILKAGRSVEQSVTPAELGAVILRIYGARRDIRTPRFFVQAVAADLTTGIFKRELAAFRQGPAVGLAAEGSNAARPECSDCGGCGVLGVRPADGTPQAAQRAIEAGGVFCACASGTLVASLLEPVDKSVGSHFSNGECHASALTV